MLTTVEDTFVQYHLDYLSLRDISPTATYLSGLNRKTVIKMFIAASQKERYFNIMKDVIDFLEIPNNLTLKEMICYATLLETEQV